MYIILLMVVIVAIAIIYFRINHEKKEDQKIHCTEGLFTVRGTKKCFTIEKDDRFIFFIENGQIMSVKDKSVSSEKIKYRGI